MKRHHTYSIQPLALLAVAMLSACKSANKKADEIIVQKPVEIKKEGIQAMRENNQERDIEWGGESKYHISIHRAPNAELPTVKDENGVSYYDNDIVMKISKDGIVVYEHKFTKESFAQHTGNNVIGKTGALLGIVFDCMEGDKLLFAASIGSPDERSDAFVPLLMKMDHSFSYSISIDNRMDMQEPQEDEGV